MKRISIRLAKRGLLLFAFFCISFHSIFCQTGNAEIDEILKEYEDYLEQFSDLQGCGHYLDAPAYAIKSGQNIFLDAVVEIDNTQRKLLGKRAYQSISSEYSIVRDHPAQSKLQGMMDRMSNYLEGGPKFTLYIVDTDDVNAFATVGGYVYFTTGILDFVGSDDELAAIMGHEMGHVVQQHTLRQYKKMALFSTLSDYADYEDLEAIAMNIDLTLNTPFDQIDEYDADRVGVNLAQKAGYDTQRFGDFFERIASGRDTDVLSKLSSTHPFPLDRKACINEWLKN